MTAIWQQDATALSEDILARRVSPVEVMTAFLHRIDEVNTSINAFCLVRHEEAMAEARRAEERLYQRSWVKRRLHGLPIAFKDMTPTKGIVTTYGSQLFRENIPEDDATVVRRTKAAGAIVIGKTQTPEFAHSGFTNNLLFGPTRNPWDLSRTVGGSSGGSAAAVACGMAPFAEGSDGGGSVRNPASCCGVFGLKPQQGRIPNDLGAARYGGFSSIGPLTRTVRDAALLMSLWAGGDRSDPESLPSGLDDYVGCTTRPLRQARIAYTPNFGFLVHPQVRSVLDSGVRTLVASGYAVDEVPISGFEEAGRAWLTLSLPSLASQVAPYIDSYRRLMTPYLAVLAEKGRQISGVDYYNAQVVRTRFSDQLASLLDKYEFLVSPGMAIPPYSADAMSLGPSSINGRDIDPYYEWSFAWPFNLTGHPCASIPIGRDADGLPIGMQVVGQRFSEVKLLRFCVAIEELCPWDAVWASTPHNHRLDPDAVKEERASAPGNATQGGRSIGSLTDA